MQVYFLSDKKTIQQVPQVDLTKFNIAESWCWVCSNIFAWSRKNDRFNSYFQYSMTCSWSSFAHTGLLWTIQEEKWDITWNFYRLVIKFVMIMPSSKNYYQKLKSLRTLYQWCIRSKFERSWICSSCSFYWYIIKNKGRDNDVHG